jgi:hypothetical protein
MLLLDIMGLPENFREGDEISIKFINNYKNYDKSSTQPIFLQNINLHNVIDKKIKIYKFLGEGSYGKVYKIKIDNNLYALKINENEDPNKLNERYSALINNNKLEKYIINMFCAGELKSNYKYTYYSIMEYGGKSIRNIINDINIDDLQIILKQLHNIIYIASKNRILLTDFKLSNLTFNSDKRVKLIDLYMYCESYNPCKECKIVKTYSSFEMEKEKRIYENPNYNYSCIFLPFAICFIDLVCENSSSHYCSKLSKKFNLDMNIKQIIPLLQISCYNYSNDSNALIKPYKNLYKHKKSLEKKYSVIKNEEFYNFFFNLLEPKREFENFISKKKLILIISSLINLDPNQRSLNLLKEKLNQ